MRAKASGDKATANALKLVVNTTYGAMLNKFNDLYDPLMGRSVCITGQLFLLELARHLYQDIPDLKIVQLNTDGIMVECAESQFAAINEICDEWQARTGFELETDSVAKIAQKDVNNYIEIQADGSSKEKGGYLVRGIAPAGAFNINNNACIVATAIKEYFVNGTPVEETIGNCNDILQFQIIAKAGVKYREAYHLVDGEKEPVQKVNRVYATTDQRYGKLFKVKAEDDSTAKIEMLPEHCVIDNDNQLSIESVDKTFYIEMAKKRINDFLGIKPEKKTRRKKSMATAKTTEKTTPAKEAPKPMNIYQKLLKARAMFLEADVKKSGKHMKLTFKYFELDDIVPTAIRVFGEVGLIPVVNFTADTATMTIIDTDNPEDSVSFTAPFNQGEPIVSNAGNQVTSAIQALGASITYMRRYLYMIALDICESDGIDSGANDAPPPEKPKAPATAAERAETKKTLTDSKGNASGLQIKQLKNVLKKLKEADPSKEEMSGIAYVTNPEAITGGAEAESDADYLIRILDAMRNGSSMTGCVADYIRWGKEVPAVGQVIVDPEWPDPGLPEQFHYLDRLGRERCAGAVRLIIVDSSGLPANKQILDAVYIHIAGDGPEDIKRLMPIGAHLTVIAPEGLTVNIAAEVQLEEGADVEAVKERFRKNLAGYWLTVGQEAVDDEIGHLGYIRWVQVGAVLAKTLGVIDYTGLTVNGGTVNIPVEHVQYPVTGEVELIVQA